MELYFTLAFRPVKMSQKVAHFSLRAFVVFIVFLADSECSTFNITRNTKGDVFQRTNSSQSCNESGASCFEEPNSPSCAGAICCKCLCPKEAPSYLLRNGNCTSEDRLMSILKDQSSKQGCDYRMVVAKSYLQCQREVFTTLDTLNPGNKTLYLCPWSKRPLLKHYELVRGFQKCEIVPEESLYLNGTWQERPLYDAALSTLSVGIGQDPAVSSDMLFLKWSADLGKQFDGLIFSLKLKCFDQQRKELNSCVHFKKAGSFTNIKPTFKPAVIELTTAQSTPTSRPQTVSTAHSTSVQQTTPETIATATLASVVNITPSTAHVSPSPVVGDVGDTSPTNQPQINFVVVILAALAGTLFGFLAVFAIFFLLWSRKRQFDMQMIQAKNASNPVYARGASDTLRMSKLANGNNPPEEEWLDYQPLVENTKPTERKDSLPGYRALSTGQRPNQMPTSNRVIRSSNYLSLFKDDPEEGREYQTLVKDPNAQNLEVVNEDKIPDYAEIEERSDSEDSFDSSDSKDYEEPPVVVPNNRPRRIAQRRQKLNNLSSDFNDYDEPEGIIVISDNEDDSPKPAINDSDDFHDYADPDDTGEDNVKCHVTPKEDLSCYHDYDDPEGNDS